ncbi:MAG: SPFH domain-containing protein [Bdellovibrionaceae bacterium]|nr:SPFH domain-containing protein [Pseudobdellovibrionaceae bacterium]
MGLFDVFKKQFIDVIDWTDDTSGVLSYRYPMTDKEIQNGAQLTVRDTQLALFVNEGKVADLFEAGLHTLATQNLPVLTSLKNWDKGFLSPFKSDLYFFSTREQLDQRWGTPNAIVIKDKQFGPMRIRAHGVYSYKLKNPKVFYSKVSGTKDIFTTEEMEGQLRSAILTHLAAFLGKQEIGFIDMAANQMEFSKTLQTALSDLFTGYGLSLESFYVQSVSFPEELQGHFDKMASMKMVGDLKSYTQFQAADSISIAAKNEGGAAGAGAGLGIGMAMSQAMTGAASGGAQGEDPMTMINKLHEMMKKGIITEQEFNAKKAELLKKVT